VLADDALCLPIPASVTEVQGIVRQRCKLAIHVHQVLPRPTPWRRRMMRLVGGRPTSSASSAERWPLATMASIVTSRASRGSASAGVRIHHFGQELLVKATQFTPMRDGLPSFTAPEPMVRKLSSRRLAPTLPGLMRYLARARAQGGYFVSRRWPL